MRAFHLPDVGEGISEGQLLEWFVAVGDHVVEGQVVAEVATDKVTVELPSPADGTVTSLHAQEGDVVPVGDVLLVLDGDGSEADPRAATAGHQTVPPAEAAPEPVAGTAPPSAADPLAERLGRVVAAPSTRRYAAERGVDLVSVQGTGPGGRIIRADVEAAASGPPAGATSPTGSPPGATRRVSLRGVRAASFEHMARSARTAATSTTTFEVDGDGLLDLVATLRPEAEARGVRVTPVTVVAACVAAVLGRHERFNATIDEESRELVIHDRVDLGVAVATDDGLVVPVLRDVAGRRVLDLATDLARMATRARAKELGLDDLRGGTFTLSSTGSIETATIVSAQPILNLPQVATLWVSRVIDRPRVRDGVLEAGPVLTASLSFDHRVVDGAEVTLLVNDLADLLAAPARGLA